MTSRQNVYCTIVIALAILLAGFAIFHEQRRIADATEKMEARDFNSAWELASIAKNLMEEVVFYAKTDSMQAVMLERKTEFLKSIGQFGKSRKWEYRQEQKAKDKYEEYFEGKR